jgi:antitoxin (DNA-binding transcriptional repressor) of toxin-antitoxin stability system
MIHAVMKTATVRDIRTRFPVVEGWLAESGEVGITKSGKLVAKLVLANSSGKKPDRLNFAEHYSLVGRKTGRVTDIAGILIQGRE